MSERNTIESGLIALAETIAFRDTGIYDRVMAFDDWGTFDDAQRIFADCDIRWNSLVEHDVRRVLAGYQPDYFMGVHEWVTAYRRRYSVLYQEAGNDMNNAGDTQRCGTAKSIVANIRRRISNSHKSHGWACPVEQKFFYQTPEWERRAKAARYESDYTCGICKTTNAVLHVHHHVPIISAYHHNFDNNFAYWKLEVLCKSCHERMHKDKVRDVLGSGFVKTDAAGVKEQRDWLRKSWAEYHAGGECQWCNNHAP